MNELLSLLFWVNLAVAGAVVAVMALRAPVRRLFGARIAYRLWLLVPAAGLAMLAPARVIFVPAAASGPAMPELTFGARLGQAGLSGHLDRAPPELAAMLAEQAAAIWLIGVAVSLALLAWRQSRFAEAARLGAAGPAVVGFLTPRIVTPADFGERYTPAEQAVVLAHEETHIARHDSRINALAALARCLAWFNPLVHVAGHWLRIDQELACDASVVAAHPKARRAYAEALLKTQLAATPLPIGCYWPGEAAHPLAERIRLLARPGPGALRRLAGAVLVLAIGCGAAWAAWAAKPPVAVILPAPAPLKAAAVRATPAAPAPAKAARPRAAAKPAPAPLAQPAPAPPPQAVAEAAPPSLGEVLVRMRAATFRPREAAEAQRQAALSRAALRPTAYDNTMRSTVEPGSAVRLDARWTSPGAGQIDSSLTAFGSQSAYRMGVYWAQAPGYSLWTRVAQKGEQVEVSAVLMLDNKPIGIGETTLKSGQTANLLLSNGQAVTVTPFIRPETAEEAERGRRAGRRIPIDAG